MFFCDKIDFSIAGYLKELLAVQTIESVKE